MCSYQPLLGFRDFYPADHEVVNFLTKIVRETSLSFGFEEYSAPVLEPLELFTAKSGDEIVNQLFNFVDKGGRHVSLRPEMTPSIARMIGTSFNSLKKPIKWFNIAENFRYERPQKGRLRSFYQFNFDIFGESSCFADAEIISLVIAIMRNFGLDDFFVRLSDRQLWIEFLKLLGVSEENLMSVLSVIDKSERNKPEKVILELNKICPQYGTFFSKISDFKSIHSIESLNEFFEANSLLSNTAIKTRVNVLMELIQILHDFGVDKYISIDFGIVRGLAYYSGFVFEVFDSKLSSRALAGGGRYDTLTEKLGYQSIPAVGVAIGDVTLSDFLKEKNLLPVYKKNIDCFIIFEQKSRSYALRLINELRMKNIIAEYSMKALSFDKQFRAAISSDAQFAVICGENEMLKRAVNIKNLSTRQEVTLENTEVVEYLQYNLRKND